MCLLCIEIMKDRITFAEVDKALKEFVVPKEHKEELDKVIDEKFQIELPVGTQEVYEIKR